MNILYFLYRDPSSSTFVAREIETLIANGHSVAVFSQDKPDAGPDHTEWGNLDIPIRYAPVGVQSLAGLATAPAHFSTLIKHAVAYDKMKYFPLNIAQASRAINFVSSLEMEINHIHSHFATRAQFPAVYLSKLFQVPWSVTTHAHDLYASPQPYYTENTLKLADRIITISEYNRDYLKNELRIPTPVDIVRAGIDPDQFRSSTETIPNRIITVASPVEKKGYDTALRAVAKATDDVDGLEYRIVGWEPEEYPEMMALIDDLNIQDTVTVLGRIPDDVLRSEVDEATIFLLPSQVTEDGDRDGIPVALMEAMAMGTPPVSTKVSGIPELIQDGVTGFLAPQKDHEAVSKCILEALDSDLETMGALARETIQSEFNVEAEVEKLIEIFEQCELDTNNLRATRV